LISVNTLYTQSYINHHEIITSTEKVSKGHTDLQGTIKYILISQNTLLAKSYCIRTLGNLQEQYTCHLDQGHD